MKKYYDICTKETWGDPPKTKWHQVGKLMELDKGGFMLSIPLLPKLYVFEQKEKNAAHQAAAKAGSEFPDDPF